MPRKYIPHPRPKVSWQERFWKYVDKSGHCWIWTGAKSTAGYGQLRIENKAIYAHRLSYELAYKKDPGKMEVLHSCDNPSCVNPDHLSIGKHSDNMHDAILKGRVVLTKIINDSTVSKIRQEFSNGLSQREIAKQFNIDPSSVSRIVNYKRRKEII